MGAIQTWLFLIVLYCLSLRGTGMKILMFGGNGFMGGETSRLLHAEGHSLTLVNRGSWRWDGEELIKPIVKSVRCDRDEVESCSALLKDLDSETFDAVVDFSAFEVSAVKPFYDWLKAHVKGIYIYISTDSVYEVSEPKKAGENGDMASKESDAVRPHDEKERKKLNREDSYGNNKLQVEEYLAEKMKKGGLPYVALRLPDVLGERDGTGRWWNCQLWLQFLSDMVPLPIQDAPNDLQTSYVYAKDVAQIISKILKMDPGKIAGQAYNLGYPNPIRFSELIYAMGKALGIPKDQIKFNGDHEGGSLFPSVTRGPIDVRKAQADLGWEVTPWEEMVQQTVNFYKAAVTKFPEQFDDIIEDTTGFAEHELNREQMREFLKRVKAAKSNTKKTEL